MATQLPVYRPEQRDSRAPQTGPPAQQTQANNGGPKGFGQPLAQRRMSQPSQGPPTPPGPQGPQAPQPGSGQGPGLYPAMPPTNPAYMLWSARNSVQPQQLIASAFMSYTGQMPTPEQLSQYLQIQDRDTLVQQLINLQQPGAPSPVQQAVNPTPQF